MAGLKGLKKGERLEVEAQAENFIVGAQERVDALSILPKEVRTRVFERYTFSLNPSVSQAIDDISLIPRSFKINRSEVVKAAVEYLKDLPEEQLIEILQKIRK